MLGSETGVKIFLRERPALLRETGDQTGDHKAYRNCLSVHQSSSSVEVVPPRQNSKVPTPRRGSTRQFQFDYVAGSSASQEDVFDNIGKSIVNSCLNGVNGTILAYGQIGTGKTYTITGNISVGAKPARHGLLPRIFEYLFKKSRRYQSQSSNTPSPTYSTPKASTPKASTPKASTPKASTPKASNPKASTPKSRRSRDFKCLISCCEIYNEHVYDLLSPRKQSVHLRLREDRARGIFIENLDEERINNAEEAMAFLRAAMANRTVGRTSINEFSSRSHAVVSLVIVTRVTKNGVTTTRRSRLNVVDLAGTGQFDKSVSPGLGPTSPALGPVSPSLGPRGSRESPSLRSKRAGFFRKASLPILRLNSPPADAESRTLSRRRSFNNGRIVVPKYPEDELKVTDANEIGNHQWEVRNINKSLSCLERVIRAAVKGSQDGKSVIPHRETKLTYLLQDCLGGNALAYVIVTVTPATESMVETLQTLKFAKRAKQIRNKLTVNEEKFGKVDYKEDNIELRAQLKNFRDQLNTQVREIKHLQEISSAIKDREKEVELQEKDKELLAKDKENERLRLAFELRTQETERIKTEHENLKSHNETLKLGSEHFRTEHEDSKSKNELLKSDFEDLKTGNDNLKIKYEALKTENGNFQSGLEDLKNGSDYMKIEYESLKSENQKLKGSFEGLKEGNTNLRTELETLNKDCASFAKSESVKNEQLCQAQSEKAELQKQSEEWKQKFEDMKAEHDQMEEVSRAHSAELGVLKQANTLLNGELQEVQAGSTSAKNENEVLQSNGVSDEDKFRLVQESENQKLVALKSSQELERKLELLTQQIQEKELAERQHLNQLEQSQKAAQDLRDEAVRLKSLRENSLNELRKMKKKLLKLGKLKLDNTHLKSELRKFQKDKSRKEGTVVCARCLALEEELAELRRQLDESGMCYDSDTSSMSGMRSGYMTPPVISDYTRFSNQLDGLQSTTRLESPSLRFAKSVLTMQSPTATLPNNFDPEGLLDTYNSRDPYDAVSPHIRSFLDPDGVENSPRAIVIHKTADKELNINPPRPIRQRPALCYTIPEQTELKGRFEVSPDSYDDDELARSLTFNRDNMSGLGQKPGNRSPHLKGISLPGIVLPRGPPSPNPPPPPPTMPQKSISPPPHRRPMSPGSGWDFSDLARDVANSLLDFSS